MKYILAIICLALIGKLTAFSQQKPAYMIYDGNGKKKSYKWALKMLSKADLIFFGEQHNDPICHWLQFELAKDLHALRDISLGAEMFERDNEEALAKYLSGEIDQKGFDSLARLWPNYKTDYKPLLDYAKENKIPYFSTNIPRRYASMVYKGGFEALEELPEEEKAWIAPLPIEYDAELPGYKNMLTMMGGHGGEDLPKAQAIKDATMAHFILQNYTADRLFIHLNGAYHSENYEGILWYINKKQPELLSKTITAVSQEDIGVLESEHFGKADVIICIPQSMTKTY